MPKRLAIVAAGVGGLVMTVGISVGVVATLSAQVTTTSHPPLPADPSHYWLIPESPAPPAASQPSTANLRELARGVALLADDDFAGALPLVTNPALQTTPLAMYARYYAGVALLGLERPDEAMAMLASLEGKVEGYLQDAVPLRLADRRAGARGSGGGGWRSRKGEHLHAERARRGVAASRRCDGGGGRAGTGAGYLSPCVRRISDERAGGGG